MCCCTRLLNIISVVFFLLFWSFKHWSPWRLTRCLNQPQVAVRETAVFCPQHFVINFQIFERLLLFDYYYLFIYFKFLNSNSLQVAGERYVYKFVCNPEALFSMAFPDNQRPSLKPDPDAVLPPSEDEGSHLPSYEDDGPYLAEGVEQCIQRLGLPDGYPY